MASAKRARPPTREAAPAVYHVQCVPRYCCRCRRARDSWGAYFCTGHTSLVARRTYCCAARELVARSKILARSKIEDVADANAALALACLGLAVQLQSSSVAGRASVIGRETVFVPRRTSQAAGGSVEHARAETCCRRGRCLRVEEVKLTAADSRGQTLRRPL